MDRLEKLCALRGQRKFGFFDDFHGTNVVGVFLSDFANDAKLTWLTDLKKIQMKQRKSKTGTCSRNS
jgi:hypothetical protein